MTSKLRLVSMLACTVIVINFNGAIRGTSSGIDRLILRVSHINFQKIDAANLRMTSCSVTARKIGMSYVPIWNNKNMRKNRILNHEEMLSSKWFVGHFYIQHKLDKMHELIIIINEGRIMICDSFINHRELSYRSWTVLEFKTLFETLFQGNIEEKKTAYRVLFDPPAGYIDDWDGNICQSWLIPLTF